MEPSHIGFHVCSFMGYLLEVSDVHVCYLYSPIPLFVCLSLPVFILLLLILLHLETPMILESLVPLFDLGVERDLPKPFCLFHPISHGDTFRDKHMFQFLHIKGNY